MDKKSEDVITQLSEISNNSEALHKLLKVSIATIAYKTTKNTTQHCICTLSKSLVKTYCSVLNKDLTENINKLFSQKEVADKIFVYNLVEGKRTLIHLKNKKWKIINFILLTKDNEDSIVEFIKTTFPSKTTKSQKKAFVGDKNNGNK